MDETTTSVEYLQTVSDDDEFGEAPRRPCRTISNQPHLFAEAHSILVTWTPGENESPSVTGE